VDSPGERLYVNKCTFRMTFVLVGPRRGRRVRPRRTLRAVRSCSLRPLVRPPFAPLCSLELSFVVGGLQVAVALG
jgi:hypothetical protein